MSRKKQSTTWFFSDWQSDENVRACSGLARGVWIEFLGIMHKAEPRGKLLISGAKPTPATLAKVCGLTEDEIVAGMGELIANGVCSVDDDGTLYSRRMVREEEERAKYSKWGATGSKKSLETALDAGFKAALTIEEKRERNRERMRRKRQELKAEGKTSRATACAHTPTPRARTQNTQNARTDAEKPTRSNTRVRAPSVYPGVAPFPSPLESNLQTAERCTSEAPTEQAPPPSPLIGGGGAPEAQRQYENQITTVEPKPKRSATRAAFDAGAFAQRATTITEAEDEEGATP